MDLFFVFIAIIGLAISIAICKHFAEIAETKGYDKTKYFCACFFLGIIGQLMVAALPDMTLRFRINGRQDKTETQSTPSPKTSNYSPIRSEQPLTPPTGNWVCSCGRTNANYVSSCSCGVNKRDIVK